jgi:hypothetical protein
VDALPRSGRLVCWFNAWTVGEATPDDLPELVLGGDAAHDVVGLTDTPQPLLLAAGRLRLGGGGASLSLPAAGDPVGLTGPPELTMAAMEAGEAALFPYAGVALVPEVVGAGVFWQALACAPAAGAAVGVRAAERGLREALLGCAERLLALDVATWRPEISDALSGIREKRDAPLPRGYSPHASQLAALALRCHTIVDLAHQNGSATVTSREEVARAQALGALDRAARHALVAACSDVPRRGHARVR